LIFLLLQDAGNIFEATHYLKEHRMNISFAFKNFEASDHLKKYAPAALKNSDVFSANLPVLR
jgi:hypothetical protein